MPAALWVLWALLPMLLAWKWVLLNDRTLSVRGALTGSDRAVCYLQDLLLWVVLYLGLMSWLRRRWRGGSAVTLVLCNLALLAQALDVRCKLLFLEPLGLEVSYFAVAQLSTIWASVGLFAGKTFWMAALSSQAALNAALVIPGVLARLRWLSLARVWPGISPGRRWQGLAGQGASLVRIRRWSPVAAAVVLVLLIRGSAWQPYHLEDNVLIAPLAHALRSAPRIAVGAGTTCDQKLRQFEAGGAERLSGATAAARGRNVVLVIIESLRFADSSLGNPAANHTPFLAELAAHGPIATSCYVQVAHSTKSIYSYLTGQYASHCLEVLESRQREIRGLAWALKQQGYFTAFLSSQYLTYQNVRGQYRSMGFDRVVGATELSGLARAHGYEPAVNSYGCDDGALLYGMVELLPTDRPYLAVIYNQSTHHPYRFPGAPGYEMDIDDYRAALGYFDGILERLIEQFRARGDFERTVYVVVGDHGEMFADRMNRGRGNWMTEDELKVPLVVAVPGADLEPIEVLWARHIDVTPTILDLLGAVPPGLLVQGRSLVDGQAPPPMYLNSWGPCRISALLEGRTKYVYHQASATMRAYDLDSDVLMQHPLTVDAPLAAELADRFTAFADYNEARLRRGLTR